MLNSAANWQWYSGSCGGTSAGSGTSIQVSPSATTTYFVRGEGNCVTPGSCASVQITVENVATPAAPTTPGNTAICDDDNNGVQRVRVDQTCPAGTTPVWYINGALASGVSGATVVTNTNSPNFGRLTYDQPVGTRTYTYACKSTSAPGCESAQSAELSVTVSPQISAPQDFSATVNGAAVNEGQTSVLCDTDTQSPNAITLAATCPSGTLQSRTKIGGGEWTGWANMLPSSQASDGVAVQYQTRCRQQPCTAESGIVTITINPKPTIEVMSTNDVKCNGGNGGSISVMGSGGTSPFTYSINPGETSNSTGTFIGLMAGTYTVKVADANSCEAATNAIPIAEPTPVVVTPGSNQSVVLGYPGPNSNCTNITASASGGTPGTNPTYTYNWMPGNLSGPTVNVCPEMTTIYTVTVADANGCTSTGQVTVFVKDVRCGPNLQNVSVCYYGVTLCVSPKIARNYLRMGATLGACGSNSPARIGAEEQGVETPLNLSVRAYPNPSSGALTVEVNSGVAGPAQLDVLDVAGRPVQQRVQELNVGLNRVEFNLGSHPMGTYLIRCRDSLGQQAVVRVQKQ